ncbi:hypothetical protein FKM82_026744 [Ascaphus truei]
MGVLTNTAPYDGGGKTPGAVGIPYLSRRVTDPLLSHPRFRQPPPSPPSLLSPTAHTHPVPAYTVSHPIGPQPQLTFSPSEFIVQPLPSLLLNITLRALPSRMRSPTGTQ